MGDAAAQHTPDDRVGGRYRGPQPGRQVDPQGACEKGRGHREDERTGVIEPGRVDDALGDGVHDFASGDQRSGRLADGGDHQGAQHREGLGAHGGTDVVRDVVGADVEGHVAAHDAGDNHEQAVLDPPGEDRGHREDDEQERQGHAQRDVVLSRALGRGLQRDDALEILVDLTLARDGSGRRGGGILFGGHGGAVLRSALLQFCYKHCTRRGVRGHPPVHRLRG